MRIRDSKRALEKFEKAAVDHTLATAAGDSRKANAAADIILEAYAYLKENESLQLLVSLLDHPSEGVRVWTASKLIAVRQSEAVKVLEEIAGGNGISALGAGMVLSEWRAGRLTL